MGFLDTRTGSGSEIMSSSLNSLLLVYSWWATFKRNECYFILIIYSSILFIIYYEIKKNIDDSMIESWNIGYIVFVTIGLLLTIFFPKIIESFGGKLMTDTNVDTPRSHLHPFARQ